MTAHPIAASRSPGAYFAGIHLVSLFNTASTILRMNDFDLL